MGEGEHLALGLALLALLLLLGLLGLGLHALDLDRIGVHGSVLHARDRGLDLVDLQTGERGDGTRRRGGAVRSVGQVGSGRVVDGATPPAPFHSPRAGQ